MKTVEKKARTVDEAIEAGLAELGASRDQVEIEVLEEGNKGLFGILGGKDYVVRLTLRPRKREFARQFLADIARAMGLTVEVEEREEDDYLFFNLKGPNLALLIGRRGQTLEALQYLVNLAAGRASDERKRIIVDVENYRQRREDTLQRLALRMAEKVRRTGERVVLEPMNSHERKVIHLALQNNPHVATHSQGEEPRRQIVITSRSGE